MDSDDRIIDLLGQLRDEVRRASEKSDERFELIEERFAKMDERYAQTGPPFDGIETTLHELAALVAEIRRAL